MIDVTCPLAAAERNDERTGRAMGRLQRQALAETADRHQAATALAGALVGVVGVKIDPDSDELPQEVIMACLDGIAFVGRLGAHDQPATSSSSRTPRAGAYQHA